MLDESRFNATLSEVGLTDLQAQMVRLHFQGQTTKQIADGLECSTTNVRDVLLRARSEMCRRGFDLKSVQEQRAFVGELAGIQLPPTTTTVAGGAPCPAK